MGTQYNTDTEYGWRSDKPKAAIQEVRFNNEGVHLVLNVSLSAIEHFLDGLEGGGNKELDLQLVANDSFTVSIPIGPTTDFNNILTRISGGSSALRDEKDSLNDFLETVGKKWKEGFFAYQPSDRLSDPVIRGVSITTRPVGS